jgi:pimeloyl-ACP methyl ester carboxylesterase
LKRLRQQSDHQINTKNKAMMLFLTIVLLGAIVLGILCLIPGFTFPIKARQGHAVSQSIASLEKVNLGGQEQWILIRGMDITKPVILFLHGGPGTSNMCLLRKYTDELEKHFIVVTWDQRGAGKSYQAINPYSSMTIDRFVLDTGELTQLLCHRFDRQKIFLVGHSWGSLLGILSIQKYPDSYHAYIGTGQIVNMQENEQISYDWTLAQAIKAEDKQAVRTLTEIGNPPYTGDGQKELMTQRRLLGKYGGELYGNSNGAFPLIFSNLISATEYTLLDKVNFFRGIFGSNHLLWQELLNINLKKQVLSFEVPIYFVLGRHDYEVPSILAEQYFNIIEAPKKEIIWFENSAHLANIEENEKFNDLLINRILPTIAIV